MTDPNRYRDLLAQADTALEAAEAATLRRSLDFAAVRMAGATRYDGSPMLDHPAETARIALSEIGLGADAVIAALLHEVVRVGHLHEGEDYDALTEAVRREFGDEVLGMTVAMCNISDIRLKASKEQVANFRDLIVSYSEDPRVILIKLADRLEVMRRLELFPRTKWREKSWESMNLYAQIAHKLGLYNIKSELEDIALKYLEPQDYAHITEKLAASEAERLSFIARFLEPITAKLDTLGIRYHIKSRTKSIFSIWTKMRKQHVPFEGVYDLFALRVIIDCPPEEEKRLCWTVFSVVTDFYTPNPERMRDWISIPKSNGYESLHTTVATKDGRWVEIQIRTERMDAVAERGIAAHWRYKGVNQGSVSGEQWLQQLRELMEDRGRTLARNFDAKPASGEIFVFTPNGDLRKLPEGATLLDFAFDIHSGLGSTCTGGRINGRPAAIRDELHNGDIVEVMTQKNQRPKADWLNFVVTSKARSRIRIVLREEQTRNARAGREEFERKLKNWKLPLTIDEAVGYLCKQLKIKTGTELYARIATQKLAMPEVKEMLTDWLTPAEPERRPEPERRADAESAPARTASDALVIDDRIGRIEYKLGKCCNPIRGDKVFGFVTVNAGITIHRADCPNARRLRENYPYRVMEARWRDQSDGAFRAAIRVVADDTTGILNQITERIQRDLKLDLRSVSVTSRGGVLTGVLHVEVPSTGVVDTVVHTILKIKGVQKAYRVNN